MASYQAASLLVFLLIGLVTAIPEKCHIPDEDWEELVDQFLSKISNEHKFPGPDEKHNELFYGVKIGNLSLTGLNNLKRYGTVRVYCKDGKPHADISMGSRGPLKMSVPWKYCGGVSGTVGTQANHVKICVGFDIEEEDGKVILRPVRVSPKWVETVDVKLDGAGDTMKTATYIASKLMPAFVKDFWIENLPWRMHKILEQLPK